MVLDSKKRKELLEKLLAMKNEIQTETDSLFDTLKAESHDTYSDPFDRAKSETEHTLNLRIEDRKQKLIPKIDEALIRLEQDTIWICEDCGEDIELKRLLARPVTTKCYDCKLREEQDERNKKI